jgi:hypothetical protein
VLAFKPAASVLLLSQRLVVGLADRAAVPEPDCVQDGVGAGLRPGLDIRERAERHPIRDRRRHAISGEQRIEDATGEPRRFRCRRIRILHRPGRRHPGGQVWRCRRRSGRCGRALFRMPLLSPGERLRLVRGLDFERLSARRLDREHGHGRLPHVEDAELRFAAGGTGRSGRAVWRRWGARGRGAG